MELKNLKNKLSWSSKKTESTEEKTTEEQSVQTKSAEEIIKSFLEDTKKWEVAYSPKNLFETITHYAKKAGITTVYYALLLYQSILSNKISGIDKALAIAALGYFISPMDIIPDFLPGGLFDDSMILFYGIDKLGKAIDTEEETKAKKQLDEWFSDTEIIEISKKNVRDALKIKNALKYPGKILKIFK